MEKYAKAYGAFLQDRETPETFVPLEQLPQRWEPYREDIVAMQEGICRLFPWLEKEFSESSFIKIKGELFEEEAWKFLSTASEVLLFRHMKFCCLPGGKL